MQQPRRAVILATAALLSFGALGCQEDNEKNVTSVTKGGSAPANAPKTQEEYFKRQQQQGSPYGSGGGYPGAPKR